MQHNSIQMLVKGNPNECEPNTLKKKVKMIGQKKRRQKHGAKILFHSTLCALPNLFFTASYPPKSSEIPKGWIAQTVTREVWS